MLLSLEFINPIKIKNYQLHSKEYSILYTMEEETFKEILKLKESDMETFFYLKDKSKHLVDEFEIKKCDCCSSTHLKFRCPKLHYMPLAQEVVYKFIESTRCNKRKHIKRMKKKNSANVFCYYELNKKLLFPNDDESSFSQSFSYSRSHK